MRDPVPEPSPDVDAALYDGFFSDDDKSRCDDFQQSLLNGVWPEHLNFSDQRLTELSFRLKARCFPHLLTDGEQGRWAEFVRTKLLAADAPWLTLPRAREELAEQVTRLSGAAGDENSAAQTLTALGEHYARLELDLGAG